MSHQSKSSISTLSTVSTDSSTPSVLAGRSEEYKSFDARGDPTKVLVRNARNIINKYQQALSKGVDEKDSKFKLDKLLFAMLDEAPCSEGQRYVAIVINIMDTKGSSAVVLAAYRWLEFLFKPMITQGASSAKTLPASVQTPTYGETAEVIVPAKRSGNFRAEVAKRERNCCAITGEDSGRLDGAHIIPFSLNAFTEEQRGRDKLHEDEVKTATWDLFTHWTGTSVQALAGDMINSPENGILMTHAEHQAFGEFRLYFESVRGRNNYRAKMIDPGASLSNGQRDAVVQFRKIDGVPPPKPEFLKIHASVAKVLAMCTTV